MVEHSLRLDHVFAALGNPARLALVERLRAGEVRVTDLARPFAMSLAAVSKHVGVLERAGIARRRIDGRDHWIGLDPRPLGEARRWLEGDARFWEARLDALDATLRAGAAENAGEPGERSA